MKKLFGASIALRKTNMSVRTRELIAQVEELNFEKWFPRVLGIILAYLGWYVLATFFPNELMPYPIETVMFTAQVIVSSSFIHHLEMTLTRTVLGFIGSMIIGSAFGIVMGINDFGSKFFTPYVILGLSIPAVAWAAVSTVIFGFSIATPVVATILTTFPFVAVNIWKGVESLEQDLINMSESFDISK
ncbi:MAG: ABC transporter permease, partial [Halobacteriaceae archaeon]